MGHSLEYTVTELGYSKSLFVEEGPAGSGYGDPMSPCVTEVTITYTGDDPGGVTDWEVENDRDPYGRRADVYEEPLYTRLPTDVPAVVPTADGAIRIVSQNTTELVVRCFNRYYTAGGLAWVDSLPEPREDGFLMVRAETATGVERLSMQVNCPQAKALLGADISVHTGGYECPPKRWEVLSRATQPDDTVKVTLALIDCRDSAGVPQSPTGAGDTCCTWTGNRTQDEIDGNVEKVDPASVISASTIPPRDGSKWGDLLPPTVTHIWPPVTGDPEDATDHPTYGTKSPGGYHVYEVLLGGGTYEETALLTTEDFREGLSGRPDDEKRDPLSEMVEPYAEIDLTLVGEGAVKLDSRTKLNRVVTTPSRCCDCCGCDSSSTGYAIYRHNGTTSSFNCVKSDPLYSGSPLFDPGVITTEVYTADYDFVGYCARLPNNETLDASELSSGICGIVLSHKPLGLQRASEGTSGLAPQGYLDFGCLENSTPGSGPPRPVLHAIDSCGYTNLDSDGVCQTGSYSANGAIAGLIASDGSDPVTTPTYPATGGGTQLGLVETFHWGSHAFTELCSCTETGANALFSVDSTPALQTIEYDSDGYELPLAKQAQHVFGVPRTNYVLANNPTQVKLIFDHCQLPGRKDHVLAHPDVLQKPSVVTFTDGYKKTTVYSNGDPDNVEEVPRGPKSTDIGTRILTTCRHCNDYAEFGGLIVWTTDE